MKQTIPEQNIIEGKHVKDWADAPYGEFHKTCKQKGIKLEYSDTQQPELKTYEARIRFTFSGHGYEIIEVKASSKEEARKKALGIASEADFDCDGHQAEVDDYQLCGIDEVEE